MLSPESLGRRLSEFAVRRKAQATDHPAPPPIIACQDVYAIFHELKGAALLPGNSTLAPWARDAIIGCEATLGRLARDELELTPADARGLELLTQTPFGVDTLSTWLATAITRARTIAEDDAALPQGYSWDSLSRARARALARNGLVFFAREDRLPLAALGELDQANARQAAIVGGAVVARQVEAAPGAGGAGALVLRTRTLAAFPPGQTPSPPWQRQPASTHR